MLQRSQDRGEHGGLGHLRERVRFLRAALQLCAQLIGGTPRLRRRAAQRGRLLCRLLCDRPLGLELAPRVRQRDLCCALGRKNFLHKCRV